MKIKLFLKTLIVLSFSIITGCADSGKEKIIISGSTTILPIVRSAGDSFRSKYKAVIEIEGSGSSVGIKSLIEGRCNIATSSRPMKDEERKAADEKKIKIKEIVIAYDMLVPVVHRSNPVDNLTIDQLQKIYDGTIVNWKEVGGKNLQIAVVSRDKNSGTYEVWNEKVMKSIPLRPDHLLQISNETVLATIAENDKAIGYCGFGNLIGSVKTLKVNGIDETAENGKSGLYPLSRKLYIYVDADGKNTAVDKFIKYLHGDEVREIVTSCGFIPYM